MTNPEYGPPIPSVERSAKAAAAIMDAFYHGEFDTTLTSDGLARFHEALVSITAPKSSVGVGEFLVQFFIAETREELTDPDSLAWFAVLYDFAVEDEGLMLQTKGALIPKSKVDLLDEPEFAETPQIIVGWDDIRAEFDINRRPHQHHSADDI